MFPSVTYSPKNVEADIHYWPPGTDRVAYQDVAAADMKLGETYDND